MGERGGRWLLLVLTALATTLVAPPTRAHEMRPSLVELRGLGGDAFQVTWKLALAKGQPLTLKLELPEACAPPGDITVDASRTVRTERWSTTCDLGALGGSEIHVHGLDHSGTEALVVVIGPDGSTITGLLQASAPTWTFPDDWPTARSSAGPMFMLGVTHIWAGLDHLLFVFGLLLVVGYRWRRLLSTITSFTVGHSITLALATLGVVQFPSASVEAVIALSILLLAADIAVSARPQAGALGRAPAVFAGVCGLVHGLGFAGALAEIGLPEEGLVEALLFFNLGVEAAQIAFVVAALLVSTLLLPLILRRADDWRSAARRFAAYGLGVPAGYWFVDRCLSLFIGT